MNFFLNLSLNHGVTLSLMDGDDCVLFLWDTNFLFLLFSYFKIANSTQN